jgi:hypothetical protein
VHSTTRPAHVSVGLFRSGPVVISRLHRLFCANSYEQKSEAENVDRRPISDRAGYQTEDHRLRERAKANGVVMGRKPKLTHHQQLEAMARRETGESMVNIGRSYNVSHSAISRS